MGKLTEPRSLPPTSMKVTAARIPRSQEVQDVSEPDANAGPQPWAVLRKTFAVDVSACFTCGGRMRVLELATTPKAIARALYRAGLGPQPPPPAPKPSAQLTLALE